MKTQVRTTVSLQYEKPEILDLGATGILRGGENPCGDGSNADPGCSSGDYAKAGACNEGDTANTCGATGGTATSG